MEVTKFNKTLKIKWWTNEELNPALIALDTETTLIESPALIPNLIITTVYDGSDTIYLLKNAQVYDFTESHKLATFCMWNASFDVAVLEVLGIDFTPFMEEGRLLDGQILYRLLNIATEGQEPQKWSLDFVTEQLTSEILSKDDSIRLTYGQYLNKGEVRYNDFSTEHFIYAALDPVATYICTSKILSSIKMLPTTTKLAHKINLLGDIALSQVTRNGINIDIPRVEALRLDLELSKVKNQVTMNLHGFFVGQKGNQKVLDQLLENYELPLTETGRKKKDASTLKQFAGNEFIDSYLAFKGFNKQQSFLNELLVPIIHPRYNTIKVTGRVSCSKPNIQQLPRTGDVRSCFIPEPSHIFLIVDYCAIELCALSSVCLRLFKKSIMGEKINNGEDLHRYLASKINKCSEAEVTKEQRQFAKIGNFGFSADMGAETFMNHAAKHGYSITIEQAAEIKAAYLKAYPEMKEYFKQGRGRTIVVTDTGFIRGNCSYTEYLNCSFQTKCAEGSKLALYSLIKAKYKVVMFIHDEIVISCPKDEAKDSLAKVEKIMIESMEMVIKGVKVTTEGRINEKYGK